MLKRTMVALVLALGMAGLLAGCGGGSTSPSDDGSNNVKEPNNAKFVGRWRVHDIRTPGEGWIVTFAADGALAFTDLFGGHLDVGTYSVDDAGNCTGDWRATTNSRVGKIEAHLESNDTVLYFKFIETNAFDNPHANNGVVFTEHRGTRI